MIIAIAFATLAVTANALQLFMSSKSLMTTHGRSLATANSNKAIFKVFHPAFPLKLKDTLTLDEATEFLDLQAKFRSSELAADNANDISTYKGLPWKVLPEIGLTGEKDILSKKGVENAWEKARHRGSLVWAYKLKHAEKGCFLLNHWKQQVVYIEEYDITSGARGYEVNFHDKNPLYWPPLTLEQEILERKWQPIQASENLKTTEIFNSLPSKMLKSPWEILFSLLISSESEPEVYQALFDTGLSPRQGLFAYMRLLEQIQMRAEDLDNVPSYRKIFETDLKF